MHNVLLDSMKAHLWLYFWIWVTSYMWDTLYHFWLKLDLNLWWFQYKTFKTKFQCRVSKKEHSNGLLLQWATWDLFPCLSFCIISIVCIYIVGMSVGNLKIIIVKSGPWYGNMDKFSVLATVKLPKYINLQMQNVQMLSLMS